MKHYQLSILFVLFMCMTSTKAIAYSIAVENDDGIIIYYNYNSEKTLSVTKGSYSYSGNIVIPDEVNYEGKTLKVTSIGESAFAYCHDLTSVTIPDNVSIIGYKAFYGCFSLASVFIPNSVITLGERAFYECGLTSVTIGTGVTEIYPYTFHECNKLTSVTIPPNVKTIREHAFSFCRGLTSLTISNGVTKIGKEAFYYCTGLSKITIPNSVTTIGKGAFRECHGLTSVTLGSGVKIIDEHAFYGWKGLVSVISLIEKPSWINGRYSDAKSFDLDAFNNATLFIPVGTKKKYKEAGGWDFKYIVEGVPDCISTVNVEPSAYNNSSVYDLSGRKIEGQKSINGNFQRGIYIRNGKKVLVK